MGPAEDPPLSDQTNSESQQLALTIAQLMDEKQGSDILILDVSIPLGIADFFVIATARNNRHAQALGRSLDASLKHKGIPRRSLVGLDGDSGWVLLDFDTVVVHVFSDEARSYYSLENLWADVPQIPFTPAENPVVQEEGWLPGPDESYPGSIGKL